MPKFDTNAQKMSGHAARTKKGPLRKIRGDTKMQTLEKRYRVEFKVRGDMRWDTCKEKFWVDSVQEFLKKVRENSL